MDKSVSSFLHGVPTAVMKRSGRESPFDSRPENPSHKSADIFHSEPKNRPKISPGPPDAVSLHFPAQSPPPLPDSQSPVRSVITWSDTVVPETPDDFEGLVGWAEGDVAPDDSEALQKGWVVPDTYEDDDLAPILSGDSEEKSADEAVEEEDAPGEMAAVEKTLEPWEDEGYIRWERAMHATLTRMKERASVKSDPSSLLSEH